MRRTALLLAILVASCSASAEDGDSPEDPCQCDGVESPETAVERATAVFLGEVENLAPHYSNAYFVGHDVTFRVIAAWKGVGEAHLTIFTGLSTECGVPFLPHMSYLVYCPYGQWASEVATGSSTSACSRTKGIRTASGDLDALGPPKWQPADR